MAARCPQAGLLHPAPADIWSWRGPGVWGSVLCIVGCVSTHQTPAAPPPPAVTTRHVSRCHQCTPAARPAAPCESPSLAPLLPCKPSLAFVLILGYLRYPPGTFSLTNGPLPCHVTPLPPHPCHRGFSPSLGSIPSGELPAPLAGSTPSAYAPPGQAFHSDQLGAGKQGRLREDQ